MKIRTVLATANSARKLIKTTIQSQKSLLSGSMASTIPTHVYEVRPSLTKCRDDPPQFTWTFAIQTVNESDPLNKNKGASFMPIKVTPAEIQNLQQMEVVVAGPDDANRLFIIDGQFDAQVLAQAGVQKKETFATLVGPVFTSKQFRRAIATASLTKTGLTTVATTGSSGVWMILSVDADWDDESGQVELRIETEVACNGAPSAELYIAGVGFHVTILAAVAAPPKQPSGLDGIIPESIPEKSNQYLVRSMRPASIILAVASVIVPFSWAYFATACYRNFDKYGVYIGGGGCRLPALANLMLALLVCVIASAIAVLVGFIAYRRLPSPRPRVRLIELAALALPPMVVLGYAVSFFIAR